MFKTSSSSVLQQNLRSFSNIDSFWTDLEPRQRKLQVPEDLCKARGEEALDVLLKGEFNRPIDAVTRAA
jgi:hypothetical protein